MEEERMRDAGWCVDRLEQRIFNLDAEGMLIERLGERELEWVIKAGLRPPRAVRDVLDCVDSWLDEEHTIPTGPCVPPFDPQEAPEGFSFEDLKRYARMTQVLQLFNSFGVGVFVGGVHVLLAEAAQAEGEKCEVSLGSVLELFGTTALGPDDFADSGELSWSCRMEAHIRAVRRRTGLGDALRPIPEGHGFLKRRGTVLSSRRLQGASRSMFLAGLIAAGLELGRLLEGERRQAAPSQQRGKRQRGSMKTGQKAPTELFYMSDQELEGLLHEDSMRADVEEELEFRLRNNRLSRMLASLKRISRGREKERGDGE